MRSTALATKETKPSEKKSEVPTLSASFKDHVLFIFKEITSFRVFFKKKDEIPYITESIYKQLIDNIYCATYVDSLAQHYYYFGDGETFIFTEEYLLLTKMAILFHNSAGYSRCRDSGLLLYHHLIHLGVTLDKAKYFAEALANIPYDKNGEYYKLQINQEDLTWIKSDVDNQITVYQQLIHDSVSIIFGTSPPHCSFSIETLNFYKSIGHKNVFAMEMLAELIVEIKALSGNYYDNYVSPDASQINEARIIDEIDNIERFINVNKQSLLFQLRDSLLTKEQLKQIFNPFKLLNELNQKLRLGHFLARSISYPSNLIIKSMPDEEKPCGRSKLHDLLIKLRKEEDSPCHTTVLGWGSPTPDMVGVLVLKLDTKAIQCMPTWSTKIGCYAYYKNLSSDMSLSDPKSAQIQLDRFMKYIKMGGTHLNVTIGRWGEKTAYNEILYLATGFDAIYFSRDFRIKRYETRKPHPHSPVLQAIYLQNDYYKITGEKLPIYEYVRRNNFIVKQTYSEEDILLKWIEISRDYIFTKVKEGYNEVFTIPIEKFKTQCVYNWLNPEAFQHDTYELKSVDENYHPEFRKKIDTALLALRNQKYHEFKESLAINVSSISQSSASLFKTERKNSPSHNKANQQSNKSEIETKESQAQASSKESEIEAPPFVFNDDDLPIMVSTCSFL